MTDALQTFSVLDLFAIGNRLWEQTLQEIDSAEN